MTDLVTGLRKPLRLALVVSRNAEVGTWPALPKSIREDSRLLFEDCAGRYPEMDPFWGGPDEVISLLGEFPSSVHRSARLLDLGCGPGLHVLGLWQASRSLWPQAPTVSAAAVDFSATMIRRATEIARARGIEDGVTFVCQDLVNSWSDTSETADVVLCLNNTLGNLVGDGLGSSPRERGRFLARVAEVLRPGGRLVLSVFSRSYYRTNLEGASTYTHDRRIDPRYSDAASGSFLLWRRCADDADRCCVSHWFLPEELRGLLESAGLCVLDVRAIGPRLYAVASKVRS